jgi:hypothetical protein
MAIFGDLESIPIPDLLSLLQNRSGTLELILGPRQHVQIGLDHGKVLWVKEGGRLLDPLQARSTLITALHARHGGFEFHPHTPSEGSEPLGWSLEQLLLSLTAFQDEQEAYQEALPDPKTRFQATGLEIMLDEPLHSFCQQAHPFLAQGASAEELAQRLGLPLDEVRFYLHKLRLLGRITPVRAYQAQPPTPQQQGFFHRLLHALIGRST